MSNIVICKNCESRSNCDGKLCEDYCKTCEIDDCALCPKYHLCIKCNKPIKYGQWYATRNLHYDCCSEEDIKKLRKEAKQRRAKTSKSKKRGMGSHFGLNYDGFCLEV